MGLVNQPQPHKSSEADLVLAVLGFKKNLFHSVTSLFFLLPSPPQVLLLLLAHPHPRVMRMQALGDGRVFFLNDATRSPGSSKVGDRACI